MTDLDVSYAADEPTETLQVDYFGFEERHRCVLPDGVSYIEHKTLNEGDRRKYLNKTNRDVRVAKGSGDAIIRMAPGDERAELLKAAITGWNLVRDGDPIPFNTPNLDKFLAGANPRIVDLIEKDIRKHNPWLLAEMTIEDIDNEIANLQEMRETVLREQEGKDS